MKTKLHYCIGLLICLICSTTFAQQPIEEWTRRYDSQGPTDDRPPSRNMIAVDAIGNSYITGTRINSNTDKSNIVTVKYSPSGEELWVKAYENAASSWSAAIAVDNSGGVYVTGTIVTGINEGVPTGYDYITIRYDAVTGEENWSRQYDGQNTYDRAVDIAVDHKGGVYVTGTIYSSPYIYYTAQEFATVRYDAATGEQSWASRYDAGTSIERAADIAVDDNGGVFVTGTSGSDAAGYDYVTVRYEANSGKSRWVNRYKTNNPYDLDVAMAIDNNGGVYITGTRTGEITGYDFITIRYDAATGFQSWERQYNSDNNGPEQAYAIAADDTGGIYVTGTGADMSGYSDYLTVRYETETGELSWVGRYNGPLKFGDFATAIAADNKGSIFVTGYSEGTYTTIQYESITGSQGWLNSYQHRYYSGSLIAVSGDGVFVAGISYGLIDGVDTSLDLVTIRYVSTTGEEDWVQRYNGTGSQHDYSIAVAVDAAGNSYVTGTSSNFNTQAGSGTSDIVTIKYSPAGDSLWSQKYSKGQFNRSAGITLDSEGGVYVTGYSGVEDNRTNFVTIRYDAATGEELWVQVYREEYTNWASSIAVDDKGGVYVTGISGEEDTGYDYVTIRYNTVTGQQDWASRYKANTNYTLGAAIAVDNTGGVYITGATRDAAGWDYITIRYDATTGEQNWARRNDGGGDFEIATAIVLDKFNVYVTGVSGTVYPDYGADSYDYVTVSYNATTGEQSWVSRYEANTRFYSAAAIAVDNAGSVYVAGTAINEGASSDFVTLRYDAATGKQMWESRYSGGDNNIASAIVVDNGGGVYLTGTSWSNNSLYIFSTVKYDASEGTQLWDVHTAGPEDAAVDMGLDKRGNIIVTGYSRGLDTGLDFLTVKYSQGQCPVLADVAIQGSATAAVSTKASVYTINAAGATVFFWTITDGMGTAYTSFSGQGTSSISVNWPASPNVYKVSVNYGGEAGCPTQNTTLYVHVFDPEAGFVTGGGWYRSPANPDYEFMQQSTRAYFGVVARYKKGEANVLQGETQLRLENGSFNFRSTQQEARTLVITGNQVFYRGQGSVTYRNSSGKLVTDPRTFAFLVAATDADFGKAKGDDRLRILVWELRTDGTYGAVVYDNQAGCGSGSLDENMEACQTISGGNITIHSPKAKSTHHSSLLAAEEFAAAPGLAAFPTAFTDRTTIVFTSAQETSYTLDLYDLKGALVKRIAAGMAAEGRQNQYELQATGLSKGLYFARLTTDQGVQTVKIVLQR